MARRSESKIAVQIAPEQPISTGRKLKIALAGFGTVGRSVAKLLSENPDGPFVLTHIYNRNIARTSGWMLFACDRSGSPQAFRMDLKTGQTRQLTDAAALDESSLTLTPDNRSF